MINRMGGFLERWAAFAGWAAFTLVVLGLGVTLGSALDRDPPVLASTVEGKANSETYRPGDTFSGVWTAKAVKACDGTADRRLEVMPSGGGKHWLLRLNDVPVKLSDFGDNIPGTIKYPVNTFVLPADIPIGTARYYHTDHFVCYEPGQWFFPIEVVYQPIVFQVVPR